MVTSELQAVGGIPAYSRALLGALTAAGDVVVVELNLNGRILRSAREFLRAARAVLSRRPSEIILTNVAMSPLGWFGRLLGIPYVPVIYGIEIWGPRSATTAIGCRCAAQVWSISEFTAAQAVQHYPSCHGKIRVLGGSIGEELFHLSRRPQSTFTILTIARLEDLSYKGIDTCLTAVRSMSEALECRYVVVGDGPALAELRSRVRAADLERVVTVTGGLEDTELHAYLEAADVVVLCSRFRSGRDAWGEGLGLVLLEAAASATAGVGAELGGTAETVVDGVTGFLVPADDADRLTEILLRLGRDRALCEKLGDNGRTWAQEVHSQSAFGARVRSALGQLHAPPASRDVRVVPAEG